MIRIPVAFVAATSIAIDTAPAEAQETLLGGDVAHGGFGALVTKVGPVLDGLGVITGARGAWVVNLDRAHALHLGFGGYGLATRHALPESNPEAPRKQMGFGYGGLEVGYVNSPDRLVHLGAIALIGAGGAAPWERGYSWPHMPAPSFGFVLEPGLTAELNLTTFSRLNLGISYRWVSGLGIDGVTDGDLSGVNGTLSILLGRF